MIFNDHSNLAGSHAFLSASSYHWINYSEEKLIQTYTNSMAAAKGTRLHNLAHQLIREGVKLPRTNKTLNLFVNDAIGFRMATEQILFYSFNAYGTADAISFRKNVLRISDFKSGVIPANMRQLEVYTALFCLEYTVKPSDIAVELRIYQNDEIEFYVPSLDDIVFIMDKIVAFDMLIENLKGEV